MFSDDEKKEMQEEMVELVRQATVVALAAMDETEAIFDGLLEKSSLSEKYAKLCKQGVDALVKEGFSRAEAVSITKGYMAKYNAKS